MKKYKIAPAIQGDLAEIAALVNSAYRGDSSREGWTTEADLLGGQRVDPGVLGQELDAGRVILCLREEVGLPILACVSLERKPGDSCYLGMLTVSPRLQAHGLGRVLLESAEQFARDWGARRMTLSVIHLREELIAWYERRGYRKTGETAPFPYDNPSFGIPKKAGLRFELLEKVL